MVDEPTGRELTTEELAFCAHVGLQLGYDDDDEDKHQYKHICWHYRLFWGALCGSPRLWMHGGALNAGEQIDCDACFAKLEQLMVLDPVLLAAMGSLSRTVDSLQEVAATADHLVYVLDTTGLCAGSSEAERTERLRSLRDALKEDTARWAALVDEKGGRPVVTRDGWSMPKTNNGGSRT